jgi:L-ribulose-5-phosphate 4-epimerase
MANTTLNKIRASVMTTAKKMAKAGLVSGASGNVSQRVQDPERDLLAITVAGKDYNKFILDDVVVIDFDGEAIEGDKLPSTETMTHVAVYRARTDVKAVIHTHSIYASALAVAGMNLPPVIDELVVSLGGEIHVAEYGFPSSEELGENVVAALGDRNAVLLRNHGVVGVGDSLEEALAVCEMVERAAQIYVIAHVLGGPNLLPKEVVEAETEIYRMRRRAKEV